MGTQYLRNRQMRRKEAERKMCYIKDKSKVFQETEEWSTSNTTDKSRKKLT